MNQPFADRREAGVELASKLRHLANRNDVGAAYQSHTK